MFGLKHDNENEQSPENTVIADKIPKNANTLGKINDCFYIPIAYNKHKRVLNTEIINELELTKSIEPDETPMYEHIFKPTISVAKPVLQQISNSYTTDVKFLKETQKFIKLIKPREITAIHTDTQYEYSDIDRLLDTWEDITEDTGFCEKYMYIDWEFGKMLNNNASFLQLMNLYNITSPIISLCIPIIVLILPFFILKFGGIEITLTEYITVLKGLISKHAVTKMFTEFQHVQMEQKIYILVSTAFYFFSVYQNILTCIKFYANMKKIHDYLYEFKRYLTHTIAKMDYYYSKLTELVYYYDFTVVINDKLKILKCFAKQLDKITLPNWSINISGMLNIGHIMQTFYQIFDDKQLHNAVIYSFGFNGFDNLIFGINTNILNKQLGTAKYYTASSNTPTTIKKMYYPKFIDTLAKHNTKNNCKLTTKIVITGPNASGKTTILKTALINTLLSQQIGYGCFDSCKLTPYDYFHSYLNIPDTSGRDSLFQAEARRCKKIIDIIDNTDNEHSTHFCIFDELYSGTNPQEAVQSAFAFMEYLGNKNNVTGLLTTHYVSLCKKLASNSHISNFHMKTTNKNDKLHYTYKLSKGISTIKGGMQVLKTLDYPSSIINNII